MVTGIANILFQLEFSSLDLITPENPQTAFSASHGAAHGPPGDISGQQGPSVLGCKLGTAAWSWDMGRHGSAPPVRPPFLASLLYQGPSHLLSLRESRHRGPAQRVRDNGEPSQAPSHLPASFLLQQLCQPVLSLLRPPAASSALDLHPGLLGWGAKPLMPLPAWVQTPALHPACPGQAASLL